MFLNRGALSSQNCLLRLQFIFFNDTAVCWYFIAFRKEKDISWHQLHRIYFFFLSITQDFSFKCNHHTQSFQSSFCTVFLKKSQKRIKKNNSSYYSCIHIIFND